jgi:hypothetical protein
MILLLTSKCIISIYDVQYDEGIVAICGWLKGTPNILAIFV